MPLPNKHHLAEEFLHELAEHGEQLSGLKGTETFVLKSKEGESRVPFWKVDVMVFRFLAAHAALAYASVSEVVEEVVTMIL
jgi:hypothetical protein